MNILRERHRFAVPEVGQGLDDVPKGVTPETIELHDSMFSGGVKVSLR